MKVKFEKVFKQRRSSFIQKDHQKYRIKILKVKFFREKNYKNVKDAGRKLNNVYFFKLRRNQTSITIPMKRNSISFDVKEKFC